MHFSGNSKTFCGTLFYRIFYAGQTRQGLNQFLSAWIDLKLVNIVTLIIPFLKKGPPLSQQLLKIFEETLNYSKTNCRFQIISDIVKGEKKNIYYFLRLEPLPCFLQIKPRHLLTANRETRICKHNNHEIYRPNI